VSKSNWILAQQLEENAPKLQSVHMGEGRRIVVGDRVGVNRDGWRDKIGTYVGKDYTKGKLKIRFEEFGGALLLCYGRELQWISVVGNEKPAEVSD
jgi:hypothetical protein